MHCANTDTVLSTLLIQQSISWTVSMLLPEVAVSALLLQDRVSNENGPDSGFYCWLCSVDLSSSARYWPYTLLYACALYSFPFFWSSSESQHASLNGYTILTILTILTVHIKFRRSCPQSNNPVHFRSVGFLSP